MGAMTSIGQLSRKQRVNVNKSMIFTKTTHSRTGAALTIAPNALGKGIGTVFKGDLEETQKGTGFSWLDQEKAQRGPMECPVLMGPQLSWMSAAMEGVTLTRKTSIAAPCPPLHLAKIRASA